MLGGNSVHLWWVCTMHMTIAQN